MIVLTPPPDINNTNKNLEIASAEVDSTYKFKVLFVHGCTSLFLYVFKSTTQFNAKEDLCMFSPMNRFVWMKLQATSI